MARLLAILICGVAVLAAADSWDKVRDLKTGTEIRVYKRGAVSPVLATMDEATADKLAVVVKNEQIAIAKDQIERVDYRPKKSRVTRQTTSKATDPDLRPQPMGSGPPMPGVATSSSVSVGSKPDFETIYRRPPAKQPK